MTGLHHFTPAVMPTLPLEIIWRIISFIKGKNDLHACSLSSQALVNPAQRELFRYILLDGETGEGVYSIMKASCRLAGYVTALELHHKQFGTDTVELLRLLTAVRHVKLLGHTSRDWRKGPILHTLRQLILPHITHLIIEDVSFPISVITTCTRLLSLTVLVSDVVDIELPDVLPSSEPSTKTLHSLQILSLDSIRNRGNAISALFRDLIATGRLSSVGCLRLPPDLDHRSRDDLSHEDLADLLGYFRDTLKCLDIDYWAFPDVGESIFWTACKSFLDRPFFEVNLPSNFHGSVVYGENPAEKPGCA
ncbi:hypothetical protein DL96DRAFT_394137 [Flagelloscypha sp. PMI_526]|nr:hypothetical protein DL96DRAFT_394137 [Flagelloscypha sp. PMI_526]